MNPYGSAESGQYGVDDQYSGEGFGSSFGSKEVRLAFIRKVYGILSVQLIITFGFICMFALPEGMRSYARSNPWLMWIAFGVTMVTMLALVCCGELRRQTPHNYICLMIFTFAESLLLGIISAIHQREIVLLAVLITAVVCLALTAFAFQTKIDFTAFNGIVFVFLIVLMVMGIILMFWRNNILFLIYSGLGALVFSAYLVIDTQMIMGGNHKYEISSEEYIFAALTLYLDIINIFLYVLQILQAFSSSE